MRSSHYKSAFICSIVTSQCASYSQRSQGHFITEGITRKTTFGLWPLPKPCSAGGIAQTSNDVRLYGVFDRHGRSGYEEEEGDDGDGNEERKGDETQSWLSWLSTGTRQKYRRYDELKMRESPKLGGLPRSKGYSSKDWFHNFVTLPTSVILRDIRSPVFFISSWAGAVSIVHQRLLMVNPALASNLCIPPAPHSLVVSALGLLLVFRTNSAYQRFAEGRKIWEQILSYSRDLSRMVKLYEQEVGIERRRRIQRLLAAFPYLLRHRIRPNIIMRKLMDPNYKRDPKHSLLLYDDKAQDDNDVEAADLANTEENTGMARRKTRELYWVDKRTLPWRLLPKEAMENCARAQNRPLWVCDRMGKELAAVPDQPNFTARERLSLLGKVDKLSHTIGQCERIHQTVVPLNYARHCLRSLTIWLLSLPFALVKDLGLMTGPVIAVMSWLLFGVYEIGYSIEDPFQGTLRLSILCDAIRRDVLGNELHRGTAFKLDDPGLHEEPFVEGESDGLEREDTESSPVRSTATDANGSAVVPERSLHFE